MLSLVKASLFSKRLPFSTASNSFYRITVSKGNMIWKEGSRSLKEYLPIKDADYFLHFPELAKEVQIEIWDHVCEIPRVVELGSAPLGSEKR
jgi:hypothetical protein